MWYSLVLITASVRELPGYAAIPHTGIRGVAAARQR